MSPNDHSLFISNHTKIYYLGLNKRKKHHHKHPDEAAKLPDSSMHLIEEFEDTEIYNDITSMLVTDDNQFLFVITNRGVIFKLLIRPTALTLLDNIKIYSDIE